MIASESHKAVWGHFVYVTHVSSTPKEADAAKYPLLSSLSPSYFGEANNLHSLVEFCLAVHAWDIFNCPFSNLIQNIYLN